MVELVFHPLLGLKQYLVISNNNGKQKKINLKLVFIPKCHNICILYFFALKTEHFKYFSKFKKLHQIIRFNF